MFQPQARRFHQEPSKKWTCIIMGGFIGFLWTQIIDLNQLFFNLIQLKSIYGKKQNINLADVCSILMDGAVNNKDRVLVILACLFVVVNFVTFMINLIDKMIACWDLEIHRFRECTLHLWSAIGGAPATAAAMLLICHKSSKTSYQQTYIKMCYLHIAGLLLAYACYVQQNVEMKTYV